MQLIEVAVGDDGPMESEKLREPPAKYIKTGHHDRKEAAEATKSTEKSKAGTRRKDVRMTEAMIN